MVRFRSQDLCLLYTELNQISYYFDVGQIEPRPDVRRRHGVIDFVDQWLPPRGRGNNIISTSPQHPTPVRYMFGHNVTRLGNHHQTMPIPSIPDSARPFQCYSVYHHTGIMFTVPLDVTNTCTGNGSELSPTDEGGSEDEGGRQEHKDWAELSFGQSPDNADWELSFACHEVGNRGLLAQRRDQRWVDYFLPDRYQPQTTRYEDSQVGMVGELALLIGLVSLALPRGLWVRRLPQIIVHDPQIGLGWQMPPDIETQIPRRSGCEY